MSVSLSKLLSCNQEQPTKKKRHISSKPEESLLIDDPLNNLANDAESNDVDSDRRTEEDDYAES